MASTKLNRTATSTGNRKTWTWSGWVKRAAVPGTADAKGGLFATYTDSNNRLDFGVDANHRFFFKEKEGSGATLIDFTTNRLFQDPSAFYHFVIAVDTTDSTAADRVKIYVNGERITSWLDSTAPSQDRDTLMNLSGRTYYIGTTDGSSNYWNGLMSHVHFCDGTALAPTVFGSTDSTTGEWKINTSPSFTLGTNGFTILKDGNTITDQSSNSNDFTLGGGTLTNSEDNPSNVFCTFNPLFPQVNTGTSKGNTRFETTSGSGWRTMPGTLGMEKNTGKYYMEFKHLGGTNNGYGIADYTDGGVVDKINRSVSTYAGNNANSYGYLSQGEFFYNGSYTASGWNSYTTNDIIGMAVDMENMKLYFHKNGTYENSGNPTAGSGGYTIADPVGAYLPVGSVNAGILCANFGNGIFDTTAISSEGTNASGIGKFEYDVPTGYTALSTKGLNE